CVGSASTNFPWTKVIMSRERERRSFTRRILRRQNERRSRSRVMITFVHGKLVEALPTQATVDVNGVGYEVLIPLSSFDKLPPPGYEVKLLTHLAVREDAHLLYGFVTTAE